MTNYGLPSLNLYVHIPFCETKCPYCDFNTYAGIESSIPSYIEALQKEISVWGKLLRHRHVNTVFFGGGTPSYLPENSIGSIMEIIRSNFDVTHGAEVTLEANPGDLTPIKLAAYPNFGVNRLSIGVQALDDHLLKMLGRRHTAEQAVQAYNMAIHSGFKNVNIDLIYGLPYQTSDTWHRTLASAISLNPLHVSMYCLTLEEGTPMEKWVKSGLMPTPDPDLAADMYLEAQEAMRHQGYHHYEISNWAKPGFESLHNLTYWRNQPYLGVGPGAHSYLDNIRFFNLKSPKNYVDKLIKDEPAPLHVGTGILTPQTISNLPTIESVETIDQRLEMAETLIMGLRLDTGICVKEFKRRFAVELSQIYGETIDELTSLDLLENIDNWVRLTPRGKLLGNEVFIRFLAND